MQLFSPKNSWVRIFYIFLMGIFLSILKLLVAALINMLEIQLRHFFKYLEIMYKISNEIIKIQLETKDKKSWFSISKPLAPNLF